MPSTLEMFAATHEPPYRTETLKRLAEFEIRIQGLGLPPEAHEEVMSTVLNAYSFGLAKGKFDVRSSRMGDHRTDVNPVFIKSRLS